ncbi:hypothetical protein N7489_005090 [Penicillium chrysogenum]|uniref:uncharacterized protein n=1 Tax=Penicillium chrysogenum TaxID=5076 RepID=UPI0024DF0AB1|nr:uncharacterized protein N7489_005090 [Penicillium chrysogenum]KAJ5244994.1 hypothetical protein N7489_005090 [Penicillium chrysogenum]
MFFLTAVPYEAILSTWEPSARSDAIGKGAEIVIGGQRATALGPNFYHPTTEKEVVDLANHAEVGLARYFFSGNVRRIFRVAEALDVGMVGVITGLISDVASPFGGVKQSGFGREGSKYGIDEFMTIKSITFGSMSQPLQE